MSRQRETGNFFRVDIHKFRKLCLTRNLNMVKSYLIMACGTDGSNQYTTWSSKAVEKYGGMTWKSAKAAINELREQGFIDQVAYGRKPKYRLLQEATREPLDELQLEVLDRLVNKTTLETDASSIELLIKKGWARRRGRGYQILGLAKNSSVWLPNEIVTKLEGEGTSLLNRIAMSRDTLCFAIMAELYVHQDLEEHDGISRSLVWKEFASNTLNAFGDKRIIGVNSFHSAQSYHSPEAFKFWAKRKLGTDASHSNFWAQLSHLHNCGAFEWVAFVFEGEDEQARPVHPIYRVRKSTVIEDCEETLLGLLAYIAAIAITGKRIERVSAKVFGNDKFMIPVESYASKAKVYCVPRMTYRPKTEATSRWYSVYAPTILQYRQYYGELIRRHWPEIWPVLDERFGLSSVQEPEETVQKRSYF